MTDDTKTKSTAVVVRSTVPKRSNYRDYRQVLRFDFVYSCAYCATTELEAQAIAFEIDHYRPTSKNPELRDDAENLLWSCGPCNGYKSDYEPNSEQLRKGYYVVRPDVEDPSVHYEVEGQRLKPVTDTGYFNIERLDLNRLYLRRLREIRRRYWDSREYMLAGVRSFYRAVRKLPPQTRRQLVEKEKKVVQFYEQLADDTQEFARQLARSPALDDDPEAPERQTRRRKFLRGICAIGADAELPSGREVRSARKSKRGRRKRRR